jgi:D-aminopeptidase
VGLLTLCNFGDRRLLTVAGVPVGRMLTDLQPVAGAPPDPPAREGSIILVVATDAPLIDRQLGRLCRRATLGLARTGSVAGDSSGDLLLAFSTAFRLRHAAGHALHSAFWLADERLNPLFEATVEAAEEAVINALCAATTTTGRDGNTVYALPTERLPALLRAHGA